MGVNGIWMDATDKVCQFDALPWYDQDRMVLAVMDDSSIFKQTPELNYLSNRTRSDWQIDLQPDGSAYIEGENRIWGAQANDMRFDLGVQSDKDKKKLMERKIGEKCNFVKLDSMSISRDKPIKDPLVVKYSFSTEKFANNAKEELLFCPGDISNINLSDYFIEEQRYYPIHFKYGMQQQVNLTVNIPQNWQVSTAEENKTIQSDFGEATWRWYTNDNKLHIQTLFILKGDDIDPSEYPKFKSFLREVKLQELKQVVFTKQ